MKLQSAMPMRYACGLWFMVAAAMGCAPATDAVPAGGVVTLEGVPVEGATVGFLPRDANNKGAYGKTDAEGRFRLQTYSANDGAVPGEYDVTIHKVHITPEQFERDDPRWKPPPPPRYLVPKKYSDPNSSGLKATVTKGKRNEFTFQLTQ
jgi:hypothetical protein